MAYVYHSMTFRKICFYKTPFVPITKLYQTKMLISFMQEVLQNYDAQQFYVRDLTKLRKTTIL